MAGFRIPGALAAVGAAAGYPWLLALFHRLDGQPQPSPWRGLVLAACFAPPLLALAASRGKATTTAGELRWRRAAYLAAAAPTAFVFLGVTQTLLRSPVPDILVWDAGWAGLVLWAALGDLARPVPPPAGEFASLRLAHGVVAAVLLAFLAFHLANHLAGLAGPEAHEQVMQLGRRVYRAPIVEPLLAALLLFQAASGLRLAWRRSAQAQDLPGRVQTASGVYLLVFALGHMNSVFLYARRHLGIETDWAFATGAPVGLLHDAWNIRLVPHYALGVFFALAHLACGLRQVLLAHGAPRARVDAAWTAALAAAAGAAAAILSGMCGVRLPG